MSSPRKARPSTSNAAPGPSASTSAVASSSSAGPSTPAKGGRASTTTPKSVTTTTTGTPAPALATTPRAASSYLPAVSSPLKLAPLSSSPLRFQVERSPRVSRSGRGSLLGLDSGERSTAAEVQVISAGEREEEEEGDAAHTVGTGIAEEDEERVEQALLADADADAEQERQTKRPRVSAAVAAGGRQSRGSQGGGSATTAGSPRKVIATTERKSRGSLAAPPVPAAEPTTDASNAPAASDEVDNPNLGEDDSLEVEGVAPSSSISTGAAATLAQDLSTAAAAPLDESRLARLQRGLERFLGLLDGKSDLEHFLQAFPTLSAEEIEPVRVKFVEDVKELIKSGHHSLTESYDLHERLPLLEQLCLEADRRADRGLPLDHEEMKDVFRPDLDISTALNAKALQGRRERVAALEEQLAELEAGNALVHAKLVGNVDEAERRQAEAKALLDAMERAVKDLQPDAATEKRMRTTLDGLASELGPRV